MCALDGEINQRRAVVHVMWRRLSGWFEERVTWFRDHRAPPGLTYLSDLWSELHIVMGSAAAVGDRIKGYTLNEIVRLTEFSLYIPTFGNI